jgi:hypothetical protein
MNNVTSRVKTDSPPARPLQRQERKVPAHHRPRHEVDAGEAAVALGVVQVRQRAVRRRLVDPARDVVEDQLARPGLRDGGRLELPVRLGVQVAAVERDAVALYDDGVVGRLVGVDAVRDEVAGAVGGEWGGGGGRGLERALAVWVEWLWFWERIGGFGEAEEGWVGCNGRVETEQCVGVEAIQSRPAPIPVVRQFRVGAIPGNAEFLPLLDVAFGYILRMLA